MVSSVCSHAHTERGKEADFIEDAGRMVRISSQGEEQRGGRVGEKSVAISRSQVTVTQD